MDQEKRIEALENQVLELVGQIKRLRTVVCETYGEARAVEQAVLALVQAHAPSQVLACDLKNRLALTEAMITAEVASEEHLTGMQRAQNMLLLALAVSMNEANHKLVHPAIPTIQ